MSWPVSLFDSARDNRPRGLDLSYGMLRDLLTSWHDSPGKDHLPAWSPVRYPAGARRSKRAVDVVSCLVYDVDDGMPIEAAAECWRAADHSFVLHTSWSHTPEHPKFRIVLPLFTFVPALQWGRGWRAGLALWRDVCGDEWSPDPACSDSSRLYYLPGSPTSANPARAVVTHAGDLLELDWEGVPVEEPAPRPAPTRWPSTTTGGNLGAEIRRRLNEDPAARRALGRVLGGAVGEELVRRVRCPSCSRPSVWWPVDPARRRSALCNHRNSCGWWGHLDALAYALGVSP